LAIWFIALTLAAMPFFFQRVRSYSFDLSKDDVMPLILLVGVSIPLFILFLDRLPIQMAVDEVVTLAETKEVLSHARDWLGPSGYHDYPNMGYVCFGNLAKLFGSLSITTLREANALIGIVTVAALYVFYRSSCQIFFALNAATVAGFCHSFIGLSKIGIRGNVDVLVEVISYTILIASAKLRCQFLAFLGGATAGGAYYFYYPARSTIIVWGLTNALASLPLDKAGRREVWHLFAISLFAFFMTALPEMIASAERADPYVKQQLLFTKEGMAQQMDRESTHNPNIAYFNNVTNSLSAFNTNKTDSWGNYWNPGHGLVEPITGLLLWIGLLGLVLEKKERDQVNWVATVSLTGFCVLLFVYTFILSTAPAYTRAILLIPFVGFFAVKGAFVLGAVFDSALSKLSFSKAMFLSQMAVVILVLMIFASNLAFVVAWLNMGFVYGDRFGTAIRYVEARHDRPDYKFYIVTSIATPSVERSFLPWKTGTDSEWLLGLASTRQEFKAIEPESFCADIEKGLLDGKPIKPPLTVFVTRSITPCLDSFVRLHPQVKMYPISPGYEYAALELDK